MTPAFLFIRIDVELIVICMLCDKVCFFWR